MKKPLKKIPKTAELMWVLGIFLVALGVTMSKKADLGVSMIAAPTFIVYEAIRPLWAVSVGTVEYLVQGAILLIMCAVVQRVNWRYLLAFAVAVIYGYVMDMWMLVFKNVVLTEAYLKWIMLIAGDVMTAAGVACFFRTYCGTVRQIFPENKQGETRFRLVFSGAVRGACSYDIQGREYL